MRAERNKRSSLAKVDFGYIWAVQYNREVYATHCVDKLCSKDTDEFGTNGGVYWKNLMQDPMLIKLEALIPILRRYARFLLRDVHAADDLVQDCLERSVRYAYRFEKGTNLRAWTLSILRNCFYDGKRRDKRRNEVALDVSPIDAMRSPARQEDNVLLRELATAFAGLPDDQKLAMICVIFEGQPYEEAAATLGVAVGTVKSRVARGREALRLAVAAEPLRRSA